MKSMVNFTVYKRRKVLNNTSNKALLINSRPLSQYQSSVVLWINHYTAAGRRCTTGLHVSDTVDRSLMLT